MDPLGIGQANCFRTHNELTMDLLGKYPLAPSENTELGKDGTLLGTDWGSRGVIGTGGAEGESDISRHSRTGGTVWRVASRIGKHRDVNWEPGGDCLFASIGIESRRWRRDVSGGETKVGRL